MATSARIQYAKASPDGQYLADVAGSRLTIRSLDDGLLQTHPLPANYKNKLMVWHTSRQQHTSSPSCSDATIRYSQTSGRLLIADEDNVRVFDAQDSQWKAVIKGAAGASAQINNVAFGRNEDQIFVSSTFGLRMMLWFLSTSRGIEIRDTKAITRNHDFRPRSAHLALLVRPTTHDHLLLMDTNTFRVHESIELPTTDAQAVRWSPDGRWLAVQDAISAGYRILIYTADGHLFKVLLGGQDAETIGHGIRTMMWSPNAQLLAVGAMEDHVILYNSTTVSNAGSSYFTTDSMQFAQRLTLTHSAEISIPHATVWEEHIDNATRSRTYATAAQPIKTYMNGSLTTNEISKCGVSTIRFSKDGTLLATRSDTVPSTVWIWSLSSMIAFAVLLHHAPVKSIEWHPTISDLLLVHCAMDEPVLHIWKESWDSPKVITALKRTPGGRVDASWIYTSDGKPPMILLVSGSEHTMVQLSHEGEVAEMPEIHNEPVDALGPDDRFDEGHSMDFSAVKLPDSYTARYATKDAPETWIASDEVEDTFKFKHNMPATVVS